MRQAGERTPGGRRTPPLLAALALAASPLLGAGSPALQEYLQVREWVRQGDYARAEDLALRLASHAEFGALFRGLPDQVRAERVSAGGDVRNAARLYESISPAGGCLVAYAPSYWNSCVRLADLYRDLDDAGARVEMLRRLIPGAGVRDARSPASAYVDLGRAYEDAGDPAAAVACYRTAADCFDSRRERRDALEGLRRLQAPPATPAEVILENALSDDPVLRHAGLGSLWRLADPAAAYERLLRAGRDPEGRAGAALAALPLDDLAQRLRETVRRGDPDAAPVAADALRRLTGLIYPAAEAAGGGALDFNSPFYRLWGTPFLVERLEDPFEAERIRLLALDAIGHTGDPRGLDAVLRASEDRSPARRAHAVHALRSYGHARVERALLARLEDPDPLVRVVTAAQLARRRLPDAADALARAQAQEREPWAAAALGEALALAARREGETPATPLLDRLLPESPIFRPPSSVGPDSSAEEIFDAALLGIPPPEPAIARLLESDRLSEYRPAAVALANAGARSHLHDIRRRARTVRYAPDGSERTSYDATLLEVLGWLEDDAAIPLLREALASPQARGQAQAAAARALGRLGDAGAVPSLVSAFTDPRSPEEVRRAAGFALARIAPPDLGAIVLGGLESFDPQVREATLLLLREAGRGFGREVAARLAIYDPDPRLRRLAAAVAESEGAPAPDPLASERRR